MRAGKIVQVRKGQSHPDNLSLTPRTQKKKKKLTPKIVLQPFQTTHTHTQTMAIRTGNAKHFKGECCDCSCITKKKGEAQRNGIVGTGTTQLVTGRAELEPGHLLSRP